MENKDEINTSDKYITYYFEGLFQDEYPCTLPYPFIWPVEEEKDELKQ